MAAEYLSRDREHLAALQRARRKSVTRIDYMPGKEALAAIDAKKQGLRPGSAAATNSAILDAIVTEWADWAGINKSWISKPKSLVGGGATRLAGPVPKTLAKALAVKPTERVVCGAKRHRDGQPCKANSEPGKRRCRFHGGMSTGPRTPEGKARVALNLRCRERRACDEV